MYMYMYTYLLCVEAISHNLFYSQFTPEYQQILSHIRSYYCYYCTNLRDKNVASIRLSSITYVL